MKRNVSLIGTGALMFGTFLPIVHAPLLGSLSAISRPDGVILFVIAVLGAIFDLG
jgi:hypothetical protein